MKETIRIEDSTQEVYYINPKNVVYIKERKASDTWKISLVNGESILTQNSHGVSSLISTFNVNQNSHV